MTTTEPGNVISVRTLTYNDIPAGMRLSTLAGWNQTRADWELFLEASPEGSFVAESNGQVVGTTATITYEGRLAWIGLVLVDPQFRRMGIGKLLMQRALQFLEGCPSIKLDASADGKKLYDTLGFFDECEIHRLTREPGSLPSDADTSHVVPLTEKSLGDVLELDRKIFGVDRHLVLGTLLKNAPESAFHIQRQERVCGFCLGRKGANHHQVGPVVAETLEDAQALIQQALRPLSNKRVLLDVSVFQTELLAWLGRLGFVAQRSFVRMYCNANSSPGIPAQQFAIAGPELG